MRLLLLSGLTLLLVLLEQRDSLLLRKNTGECTDPVQLCGWGLAQQGADSWVS